jgi:hypothetical protein
MGVIRTVDFEHARATPERTPWHGRLSVTITETECRIRLRVRGGRTPVRLYLYVDGDLADSWVDVEAAFDVPPGRLAPGPHAVTARAVDALGRWAAASTIVER